MFVCFFNHEDKSPNVYLFAYCPGLNGEFQNNFAETDSFSILEIHLLVRTAPEASNIIHLCLKKRFLLKLCVILRKKFKERSVFRVG